MSDLQDYMQRADANKAGRLWAQHADALIKGTVTCGCGQARALTMAFRCLYCGEWFCRNCAEIHFGQTVQEWIVAKRIEKRHEMEKDPNRSKAGQMGQRRVNSTAGDCQGERGGAKG